MTGHRIRRAAAADARALAQLRFDFRQELGTVREERGPFEERCASWMEQRLAALGRWQAWVAETPEGLLGCLWLQLIEKIPNPGREPELHAYVTNFYLTTGARGRGLGSDILSLALTWCREHEVDAVLLWPSAQSRSLYQRHGFRSSDDLLELRLPRAE